MTNQRQNVIVLLKDGKLIDVFTSIEALLQSEVSPLCGKITRGGLQKVREKQNGFPFDYLGYTIQKKPLINQKTKNFTDDVFDDPDLDPSVFD